MNDFVSRIERDYPVRRKAQEKERFRIWLVATLREMGYHVALQSNESALQSGGRVTNVVVGDPEKAKIIFTAHYDTPLCEVLPPLICPTRSLTYVLYQALTPILALVVSFLVAFALTFPFNAPFWTLPIFLVLLLGCLAYLKLGPSEKNNVNDNTSGVVTLLEIAKSITPRYRGNVCFVFFDCGAQAGQGAKAFRKKYPVTREKSVIHLDCVGDGDEILFLPSKYSRWNSELLDFINESFEDLEKPEGKTVFLKTDGLVYYPSDNRAFRYSTAVCAVKKLPGFGRCISPRKTTEIDEANIDLLSRGLCALVMRCG